MKKITKTFLKKHIKSYSFCPLCNYKKRKKILKFVKNRYSEELSKYLNIKENELLKLIQNVQCLKCSLIYKSNWFKKGILKKLFSDVVPIHPKGWDRYLNIFTKKNLLSKINKCIDNFINDNFDNGEIRHLISIVDSIATNKNKDSLLKKDFIKSIKNHNIDFIKKKKLQLVKILKVPEPYKRFSGFSSDEFYNFIESKVGPIYNYAEIGCPLWGMLDLAHKKNLKTYFINGGEENFWGAKCINKGRHCSCLLTKKTEKIEPKDFIKNKSEQKKFDFLGVFFYLDHLTKIKYFLNIIFKQSRSAGFILGIGGLPIQHFTSWNKKSILYASKLMNKKVDFSFKKMETAKSNFFLIY
jgi:hypothetical protein